MTFASYCILKFQVLYQNFSISKSPFLLSKNSVKSIVSMFNSHPTGRSTMCFSFLKTGSLSKTIRFTILKWNEEISNKGGDSKQDEG